MIGSRPALALAAAVVLGCATNTDYVTVDPVRFVPVIGKDGPRCQGWCPASADQATKFRVKVGNVTFHRITNEAKAQGKDRDRAFLDFATREVEARGFCTRAIA